MTDADRSALLAARGALWDLRPVLAVHDDDGAAPELTIASCEPEDVAGEIATYRANHGKAPQRVRFADGTLREVVGCPDGDSVLAGRVALVTGGAQGFGAGIAAYLAEQGAWVAVADINGEGAVEAARDVSARFRAGCALGVTMNVGDSDSVSAGVREVVERWGGIDLLVSNAGVLRAGSVLELSPKDFAFVTDVNYTGFFLCTKHVAAAMSLQAVGARRADIENYQTDVVQINSKSGLAGSNKNGAYAGSKFGSIGLVQSFAMELVEHGIKVNAVCPGNFLDGPLWSDPDRGLFVQYLRAGKVPGAKTIDDVRRFYEAKVPLGRGCRPADVNRAIRYAVEQSYETGQAIPVTGGQIMLS